MEQPIVNPPNPYVGSLRIFPGTMVKVSGRARPNATRFAINFQTGPSLNPRDDLALHLSPCFTPPRIVRNSLRGGAWGVEEAWSNGSIFSPHQPFEIIILAETDQFKIAINGAHYCEFRHRMPYQDISHLTIDGDVDIDRITITSSHQQPQQPAYQPSAPAPYPSKPGVPQMPVPSAYPILPAFDPQPSGPYQPQATSTGPYPPMPHPYSSGPQANYPGSMPVGPMPTGASYMGGSGGSYPQAPQGPSPYPQTMPGGYPMGGPNPTGPGYQGYPGQHNQQPQPGHSSSSPFGNLPIGGKALGTLAGLGLGAAATAAVVSTLNPLKLVKKIAKPKGFKHKGWGGRSSSSSNSSISSRGSFSSNSS